MTDGAGKPKWQATPGPTVNSGAAILCVDLDGDGKPEVITAGDKHLTVLDAEGKTRQQVVTEESQALRLHFLGGTPPVIGVEGALQRDLKTAKYRVILGPKPEVARLDPTDPVAQQIAALPESVDARRKAAALNEGPGLTIGARTWHFNGGVIETTDLDGDGKPETVITAQRRSSAVVPTLLVIFAPSGDVVYTHQYQSWLGGIAFGDLDGDGKKEIVTAGHHSDPFTVLGR